jgi:predicted DsbA family dithiol-disulfide isomerase
MAEPIHIYSDVVCPWCFVGKTRLDKALAERKAVGHEPPEIFWHPYELYPDASPTGEDRVRALSAKYGASQVKMLDERLNAMGQAEGLALDIGKVTLIPNTFKAHRLIAFAQAKDKGHTMAGALFSAYFIECRDIGDLEVLLEIGAEQGLDREELERYFAGDQGVAQLRAEEDEAIQAGLRGVPYYLINGQPMVGAQDLAVFRQALNSDGN